MPIVFVRFDTFRPDGGRYGKELSDAENLLPLASSFRGLREAEPVSGTGDWPVVGAHYHVYQQEQTTQLGRVTADVDAGIYLTETGDSTDLYAQIDESQPDDNDLVCAHSAPSAEQATFQLGPLEDPTIDTDHKIRWRVRIDDADGTWQAKIALLQGATLIEEFTRSGASEAIPVQQYDDDFASVNIAGITDYEDLRIRTEFTVPGSGQLLYAASDISLDGWTNDGGSDKDIYQSIDETSPSDADYVQSPPLLPGGSTRIYRYALDAGIDPVTNDALSFDVRMRGTQPGISCTVKVYDGDDLIHTESFVDLSTSWVTETIAISSAKVANIATWDLEVEISASYPSEEDATAFNYARPDADEGNTGWEDEGGASVDLYQSIDEVVLNTSEFIVLDPAFGSASYPVQFSLSTVEDPVSSGQHTLRFNHVSTPPSTPWSLVTWYLFNGVTQIATGSINYIGTSETEATLTASQANAITAYHQLSVQVSAPDSLYDYKIFKIELEAPEPRRLLISWSEMTAPSAARGSLTWVELEAPGTQTRYVGDELTLFAGTNTALYRVTSSTWEDLSRAAGYAAGAVNPSGWDFASWGNSVIATNYIDEVQIRTDNTGDFADMILSTTEPKARFVAVVRDHVMLCDINLTGHRSDEIFWSAFNDETDFEPALATQCDFAYLPQVPGQPTGLVGGEFGVIFKRRGILVADWVGGSLVFRINVVSGSIGTPFPRSIVQAEGLIYFWGGSSFFVTDGHSLPQRIGHEHIARFLTDIDCSPASIAAYSPADIQEEEMMMVGAYDPHAGFIFWFYFATADSPVPASASPWFGSETQTMLFRKARGVAYNIGEDRWAPLHLEGLDCSVIVTKPNTQNSDTWLTKGTIVFGRDFDGEPPVGSSWKRFSGRQTYGFRCETKVFRITNEEAEHVRVRRAAVLLTTQGDSDYSDYTVTVTIANDPLLALSPQTITVAGNKVDATGYFPVNLTGQYASVVVEGTLPVDELLEAIEGVYLDYQVRGRD